MKVILLDNIKNFGMMGEVKNVSDGYARNYLIPGKLAKVATPKSLLEIGVLKKRAATMIEVERKNAEAVAKQLADQVISISRKASDHDTLFDGIDKADIAREIKALTRIEVSDDMVILEEKIKKIGNYDVEIELMNGIKTTVKVEVSKE